MFSCVNESTRDVLLKDFSTPRAKIVNINKILPRNRKVVELRKEFGSLHDDVGLKRDLPGVHELWLTGIIR